jgi:2-keto-4-pentenoate hydratase
VAKTGSQLLAEARFNQVRLPELPGRVRPRNFEEAYLCQRGVVEHLLDRYGGTVIGHKVACTNVTAQQQLHVDGPFCGSLLSAFCVDSPARLKADDFFMRVIEAEFAFRIARDMQPGVLDPDAIDGVLPAIEIVDSRFDDWTTIGALSLIADNACNAHWVKGALLRDWRHTDLAAQPVRVIVNGRVEREGSGAAVLGHPLKSLEWLVGELGARGRSLKAGDYITTGVTTQVYMAERGDRIVAEFGAVGSAEVVFE